MRECENKPHCYFRIFRSDQRDKISYLIIFLNKFHIFDLARSKPVRFE